MSRTGQSRKGLAFIGEGTQSGGSRRFIEKGAGGLQFDFPLGTLHFRDT